MKISIQIVFLVCVCFNFTYAQIDPIVESDKIVGNSPVFSFDKKISMIFLRGLNSPNNFGLKKAVQGSLSRDSSDFHSVQQINYELGGMPCHRPLGEFPMVVVVPDSTIKYTMLVKKD